MSTHNNDICFLEEIKKYLLYIFFKEKSALANNCQAVTFAFCLQMLSQRESAFVI